MRVRGFLLLLALVLAACGQATPSRSTSPTVVLHRHECDDLSADVCENVIAAVIHAVPATVGSSVAVAAMAAPTAPRGANLVILVAFKPWDQSDLWFKPPTWVVTQTLMPSGWRVDPWRDGDLPAHFKALLDRAGIAS